MRTEITRMNNDYPRIGQFAYWLKQHAPNIVGACVAGVIGAVCALVVAGWWVGG